MILARGVVLAGCLILARRVILPRGLAALPARIALGLPRVFGPTRCAFIAIVARIVSARASVAARIAWSITPHVAIAVAISAIAVSIAVAAGAVAVMTNVAMRRPIAVRL